MLKHVLAEYDLWCDSVAAQIPSFCAIQSWQIHGHGDDWCAQHIGPCVWQWNCNISSLLGYIAQFLNFRQKKNYHVRERGMIVFAASDRGQSGHHNWKTEPLMTLINFLEPLHKDCSCRMPLPFSCFMGPLGETPISLPTAASIRLTPTQLFWKHRQISWMIQRSSWPSCWVLKIRWL